MTYVTQEELRLADRALKGRFPSDKHGYPSWKRMEYGLLWNCYDTVYPKVRMYDSAKQPV